MVAEAHVTFGTGRGELKPSHGCAIFVASFSAVIILNAVIGVLMLYGFGWSPAAGADPDVFAKLMADPALIFGSAFATQLVFLAAVPLAARASRQPVAELVPLRPVPYLTLALAVAGFLGFGLVGDALTAFLHHASPETNSVLLGLRDLLRELPLLPQFMAVMGLSLLPACCEELLFRGVLFTAFLRRWGGAATVLVTACLFGVIHLDALQTPVAILLGVYLGLLRLRTGSLWPSMAAHFANNLVAAMLAIGGGQMTAGRLLLWAAWGGVFGLVALLLVRPADER